MNKIFNNLLVPVDFSANTEIAVKKAIEIIEDKSAVIHLLHVIPPFISSLTLDPYVTDQSVDESISGFDSAYVKLEQWKKFIIEILPGIVVINHVQVGATIQQQIVKAVKKISPQLVIIGKKSYHRWLPFLNTLIPDKLFQQTSCPVLTVKAATSHNRIKSIVFPVYTFLPPARIDLLVAMAQKYSARVYLVILADPEGETGTPLYADFINLYRLLKSSFGRLIEYKILTGSNLTKAGIQFAEQIQADLILVSPGSDGDMSFFYKQHAVHFTTPGSRLDLLAV